MKHAQSSHLVVPTTYDLHAIVYELYLKHAQNDYPVLLLTICMLCVQAWYQVVVFFLVILGKCANGMSELDHNACLGCNLPVVAHTQLEHLR